MNEEERARIRRERRAAKGLVTRRVNDLHVLIECDEEQDTLQQKADNLKAAFEKFATKCEQFTESLTDETEIEEAEDYMEEVASNYRRCEAKLKRHTERKGRGPPQSSMDTEKKQEGLLLNDGKNKDNTLNVSANEFVPPAAPFNSQSPPPPPNPETLYQSMFDAISSANTELITFDGDPLQYYPFIRSFDNSTVGLDDGKKLARLLKYTSGQAYRLIQGCSIMPPLLGYSRARKLLDERCGSPFTITELWIKKLTSGPKLKPNDRQQLQELSDCCETCAEVLIALGTINELNAQASLRTITARLPMFLQNKWKTRVWTIRKQSYRNPCFIDLKDFILEMSEIENDPVFSSDPGMSEGQPKSSSNGTRKGFNAQTTSTDQRKCIKCSGQHLLYKCPEFEEMNVKDRLEFARSHKLCFNCLNNAGHVAQNCTLKRVCNKCGKKHSNLLHFVKSRDRSDSNKPEEPKPDEHRSDRSANTNANASASASASENYSGVEEIGAHCREIRVALPILPVIVHANGIRVSAYALLDSGSTCTLCSSDLMQKLGIDEGVKEPFQLTTLSGKAREPSAVIKFGVSNPLNVDKILPLDRVHVRSSLPIPLDCMARETDVGAWSHLKNLELPRVDAECVSLLIGQDNPHALVPIDGRFGESHDQPYATKTILGWTLNGPMNANMKQNHACMFIQEDLDTMIERFWKIEDQGMSEDRGLSIEDKRALKIWEDSVHIRDDQHYELSIPFRQQPPNLPDNRKMVEARLTSLKAKLTRDKNLHLKYTGFMTDLISAGYAEKVRSDAANHESSSQTAVKVRSDIADSGPENQSTASSNPENVRCGKSDTQSNSVCTPWFLPHHNVTNPKKPEKVRIVFDCSAKHNDISLNSQVLQGPDLTNSLIGVLLRFRQHSVACISDIKAMFHQVFVTPEERDTLRFLWWEDGDLAKEPQTYRMCVHLFGGTWSPSCCNFALQRTAYDNREDFPEEVITSVLRDFYVDDCLMSYETEDEAIKQSRDLVELLARGGFQLTKWMSNSKAVLLSIPEEERGKQVPDQSLIADELPVERALGVTWDANRDCFKFCVVNCDRPLTKRGILSIIGSIYDPFGFVSPFVLLARRLLQELTRLKVGWDEVLSSSHLTVWMKWKEGLLKLTEFEIPRCVKSSAFGAVVEVQLHHFADASLIGYGVTSYLRLRYENGKIDCCLLIAKTKVAPMKQMTIPRLELSAAVLAVKVDQLVAKELTLGIASTTFWTDSTCVLKYINCETKRFQTFVANRVALIREATSPSQWRHVDSQNNPADDASRGMSAEDMISNARWLKGPEFLYKDEQYWPKQIDEIDLSMDEDPELKKESALNLATDISHSRSVVDELIVRRSSWFALKCDVAWILRFKTWMRKGPVKKGHLTVMEIRNAELEIIKYLQRQCYSKEIVALKKGSNVAKSSPLYKHSPYLYNDILVVGSRLKNELTRPAIIPKHPVVESIVWETHRYLGHCGQEQLLAHLRENYWLIGGRNALKRVLGRCFKCRRNNAPPCAQQMAELPETRTAAGDRPFTAVGIDYFGPFEVKRGRAVVKRYGCIFTCFAIRAIHIEIAHSLDTSSFINALQRFICRRGLPKEVTSDNGTNFVGAERELKDALKEWNQQKIESFMLQKGIVWKFNPPSASHFGGVWERCIRTVRKVLRSVMNEQIVDDESLSTYMCLVESIVNSRPLTTVSSDPKDLQPLTPNHLLMHGPGPSLPPGHFKDADLYSRRRWRQVQYLADLFWARWTKEYLPTLRLRQKWLHPKRNLAVGDVVLIIDENAPRYSWSMARITEVMPSNDGLVRSVRVQTTSSTLVRPIHKLCLLEENK